ncbi:hypothetical protein FJR11_19555 [Anabaena sp. UHCC 0187]|uniref:hypothetical protein n=1 Tax=Anabaena sp. UHCC 0187 TaxID=2590018 RepID=UPI0014460C76|nr:hypothetical protein [Anabaena sp. UHCC 0187]MTJ14734.1 hypothetical protein [Anabaena sp. UHCC 0187]
MTGRILNFDSSSIDMISEEQAASNEYFVTSAQDNLRLKRLLEIIDNLQGNYSKEVAEKIGEILSTCQRVRNLQKIMFMNQERFQRKKETDLSRDTGYYRVQLIDGDVKVLYFTQEAREEDFYCLKEKIATLYYHWSCPNPYFQGTSHTVHGCDESIKRVLSFVKKQEI